MFFLKILIITASQIALRLSELCNQGEFEKAQKDLFAENAVNIEQEAADGFEKETKGVSAIFENGKILLP